MTATKYSRIATLTLLVVVCALLLPLPAWAQTSATSSLLVKLVPGLTADQQAAVITRNGGVQASSIPALRLFVITVPTADLDAVRTAYVADPQVAHVEDNKTRQSETIPADALFSSQWALPKIGWEEVFGTIAPAGSAKVFILDTGVDKLHPDLAGKVLPGKSMLDSSDATTDPSGHGTWLAGIIAANTNTIEGIAGVAYDGVKVVPVRVLDANGLGQDSDVIAGVLWAADNGADVILMAFSNPGFSQNLQDAIDYAWSRGVVLVAAVGNNAVSTATFPAGDRGVMGVAGTDQNDAPTYFSNEGQSVFIAAPGIDISTTDIGSAYSSISGTSASAAIVAGVAAFMKAVDPTLTNGMIVYRIARTADPAGTQAQTGNGRVNMARALQDTSTESLQPAGADPVGAGGPFVGPYVAAALKLTIVSSEFKITAPPGAIDKTVNTNQSFTVSAKFSNDNNGGDLGRTWSAISATLTVPAGWSKSADLSGATLGTTAGSSACGGAVTTKECTYSWTVTPPGSTSTGNDITLNIVGTPSSPGSGCSGTSCSDTKTINSVQVVNPASLNITSFTAQQGPGDTIVKSGNTIALSLTAANAAAPRATAKTVAGSSVTVAPTGTAAATCGAASAAGDIAAGANRVFTYSCGTITGNGTLVFSASVSGTDDNTAAAVTAGPTNTNSVMVDNTAPTSGLDKASGNYNAPFMFSWNIADPIAGGVSSGIQAGTCNVTVGGSSVSLACSGSHSLGGGTHAVVVSATDVAGNTLSDSRSYVVIADNTAPVVTLTLGAPNGQNGFFVTSPVVGTVTANDSTTGGSNVTGISCPGASLSSFSGIGSPSASANVTVSAEGTNNISCTATDSAGNTGAGPGSTASATVKIDTVMPETNITGQPTNPTNSTSATFTFGGSDPAPSSGGPTFECKLDAEADFTACASPKMYTGLADGSHAFHVRAKDTAGNVDATPASFTWVVDTAPPLVTVTFPASTGDNGWFKTSPVDGTVTATDASNVTAITCTDSAGGLVQGALTGGGTGSASRTLTVSAEGIHGISCTATDGAGNTGAGTGSTDTATVKIDTVAPETNLTGHPTNPTNSTSATFNFGGSDPAPSSGGPTFECKLDTELSFTSCASPKTYTGLTDGSRTFQVRAKDTAGNVDGTPESFTWVVDTVPPMVTVTFPAPTGDNGWFKTSPVVGSVTATDGANVTAITCTDSAGGLLQGVLTPGAPGTASRSLTVSGDGTHGISCTATDGAGNTGAATGSTNIATLKIDTTPPSITLLSRLPAANGDGWNNTDVTVKWTCADAGSGVTSAEVAATVSTEAAGQSALGTCKDVAGNTNSNTQGGINIDKTPPTNVTFSAGINNGDNFYFGFVPPAPTCSANDALSGVRNCTVAGYSQLVGSHTVTATAVDKADNQATANRSYTVLAWTLSGFYSPVDMGGIMNVVKGGSTVPLKFEVFAGPTELTSTSVVSSILAKGVACTAGVPEDDLVVTEYPTGGTELRYDATSGQFIFNWKTLKTPGKCYDVTVTTADGSTQTAKFKLK